VRRGLSYGWCGSWCGACISLSGGLEGEDGDAEEAGGWEAGC
jgi:hypothetical protein